MKKNKKLVPKRRFKEFENEEEWEKYKLKDVVRFSKGKGYAKRDLSESGTPIILYGRLYTNFETVINEVDTFTKPKENSVYSTGSEVIVPSSGETAEDIARAAAIRKEGVLLGGDLNIMHLIESKDPVFLALSISNGDRKKELIKRAQGSSVVHLYNTDLEEAAVFFPKIEEQKKISKFFSYMDNLISLQKNKVEKSKELKNSYLSDMFPKEGEQYPKKRFEGFTEPWEKYEVGNIMGVTSVKRIHQSDWRDSGVRFLRARDIVSASKNEQPSDYLYISQEKYDKYTAVSGKVSPGDLLVTGVGTIGVPYLIKDNIPLFFKDGNIIWFKNNNLVYSSFLYYSFVGPKIQKFIRVSAGTGTVGTYTIDSGRKTPLLIPSKDEQIKIGKFFQNLDKQIGIEEQKLNKLEQLKQAYLNELFV